VSRGSASVADARSKSGVIGSPKIFDENDSVSRDTARMSSCLVTTYQSMTAL
jgi:hypothetical protein